MRATETWDWHAEILSDEQAAAHVNLGGTVVAVADGVTLGSFDEFANLMTWLYPHAEWHAVKVHEVRYGNDD